MICAACGAESEAGVRYCRTCGAALVSPVSVLPPPSPYSPAFAVTPMFALPSGNDPAQLLEARGLGWNWGGFFLPYWWLLGHGHLGVGLLLLVSMAVPFVNITHFLLYPATGIYLGLNGYELAWKHSPYHSVAQLRDRERAWGWWGFAGMILFVVGVFVMFAFWASLTAGLREALQGMSG